MEESKYKKSVYTFSTKSVKGLKKALEGKSRNTTFCTILYNEYQLDANMRAGGSKISVNIYTDKQRKALHRALKRYGMENDDLNKLFNKEHMELKNENENTIYMRKRNISESKDEQELTPTVETIEENGVEVQSVAKVLGTIFNRYYEGDDADTFNMSDFYEDVKADWDGVIDEYDKSNEADADEENADADYELDEPLSDGSVGLKELGVKDEESLEALIMDIAEDSDMKSIMKDEAASDDSWEDRTRLDGNDALASFDALVDAVSDSGIVEDDDDDTATENKKEDASMDDLDPIDVAIKEGYQYAKIADLIAEAKEEGRKEGIASVNEERVDVNLGKKSVSIETNKKVSEEEIKEVIKLNLKSARAIVAELAKQLDCECLRDVKVPNFSDATVETVSKAVEDVQECVKCAETKEQKDAIKKVISALKVVIACLKSKTKKNESVTSAFVKYRKMFEGEGAAEDQKRDDDEPKDGDAAGDAGTDDKSSDNVEDTSDAPKDGTEDKDDKGDDEDGTMEFAGLKITVEKSEKGGDDFADEFKKAMIEYGISEDDITEEDNDDENKATFSVDGGSCDKLIDFANEYGFDIESELDADVDKDDKDDDKADDNKDDDKDDEGDNGSDDSAADDKSIDDMWNEIFGSESGDDASDEGEQK